MADLHTLPFQPEHLDTMDVQPRQLGMLDYALPGLWQVLAQQPSVTVMRNEKVLFCGGIVELWPGRAQCWAVLSRRVGTSMTAVCRASRALIASTTAARLELDVVVDHAEGHRFACLLGFTLETACMPRYYPDGASGAMYVRVRPWPT